MCGIAGIYNSDGSPVGVDCLRRMTSLQRHRGPDSEGFALFSLRDGRARPASRGALPAGPPFEGGLGVNRLRIRDLTTAADQPMWGGDGESLLAFNGEIYNADEHRGPLRRQGWQFRSRSDTEIVLALCQVLGFQEALKRLQGMFALIWVDLRERRLWMARDRLGIKPLYWYRSPRGVFLVSSEVKAFLGHPEFRPELDTERLDEHLLFRYCAGENGLLRGVSTLRPAGWMSIGPEGVQSATYWTIPTRRPRPRTGGRDRVAEFEGRLQSSVQRQLAGDVEIGCQLSGGVDSSVLTLLAARLRGTTFQTFSVVPDDPRHSEQQWMERALGKCGLQGRPLMLDRGGIADDFKRATWHLDQPVSHPNSIGLLQLARLAQPRVTVLLSGEGADELLGGYTRLLYAWLRPWIWASLPALRWWPPSGPSLRARFGEAQADPVAWYLKESAFMGVDQFSRVRPSSNAESALALRRELFGRQEGSFFERCVRYELQTYLPDLLIRQDKMSMAHSVETRVPFLDDALVDYCFTLPRNHLVGAAPGFGNFRMRNTKVVLKRLASRYFGPDFAYRPKGGFSLPVAGFLREPPMRSLVEEELLPGIRRRGLLEHPPLLEWWRNLQRGDDSGQEVLWIALSLEHWLQEMVEGRGENEPTLSEDLASAGRGAQCR